MARNNYQDFVELNVSTCGATDATAEVLTAVGNSQPEGNLVRRLEISLIRREDRPATATRATPACETFNSSIRAARPMETQPEASVGAAQADRRQLVPPAPGATAFKRGRPVALLHQNGTRQKHSCTDTCRRRDSPPQIALSGGDRDTGDGAQLGVSSAHARALVAPPSLCIFHTAFIRRLGSPPFSSLIHSIVRGTHAVRGARSDSLSSRAFH